MTDRESRKTVTSAGMGDVTATNVNGQLPCARASCPVISALSWPALVRSASPQSRMTGSDTPAATDASGMPSAISSPSVSRADPLAGSPEPAPGSGPGPGCRTGGRSGPGRSR